MGGCPFPGPTVPADGMGGTLQTNILNAVELTSTSSGTLTIEWLGDLNWPSLATAGTIGEQERGRFATICDTYSRPHKRTCSTSNLTTALSSSNGGITSCCQSCQTLEPCPIVRDLNSGAGSGIGPGALTRILLPI